MRRNAKVDNNQREICAAVRRAGCTVLPIHMVGMGAPDIIVGVSGINLLWEIKDGTLSPSARKLTVMEAIFHAEWRGNIQIVESVDHALEIINQVRREARDHARGVITMEKGGAE